MNRPLKFRIYNPLNKAFQHFTVEESIAGGVSKPQQYTGLKDKNNNLIHYKDSNGTEIIYKIEYFKDGQLKQYDDLYIPWFKKIS